MSSSSPDLSDLVDNGDDIPTGVKVNLVARAVGKQRVEVETLRADIADIKTTLKSALTIARVLVVMVPIVATLCSGAIWAILHIAIKP